MVLAHFSSFSHENKFVHYAFDETNPSYFEKNLNLFSFFCLKQRKYNKIIVRLARCILTFISRDNIESNMCKLNIILFLLK